MFLNKKQQLNKGESIASALIRFSLPLILSGILQQLYNWVDAFIVGNIEGELALAAIGASTTIISFYIMAITGFALGLSILFAQRYGSGERTFVTKLLSTYVSTLLVLFILLTALGIHIAPTALRLLHTPGEVIALSESYLQIIFLGIPFLTVYNVYSAAIRGIGDSRTPFLAILFSSVINIILDIIFVAVLRWGVTGAAAATALSQGAMVLFIIIYGVKRHPMLRFRLNRHILDKSALVQGAKFGIPPMIQSSISASGNLVLQNFMNSFGTQTVAAITTAYRVDTIVLLPIINLGSGISTLTAQSYGAGNTPRTLKVLGVGTVIMTAVAFILTVLVIPTGGYLISMFGVGPEATDIGWNFFKRLACFYVVFGLATAIRGYLEGIGDVVYSSIVGIISLLVRIAASYGLADIFGNMIIAYAEALSWGALLGMYIARLVWKRHKAKALNKSPREPIQ